MYIKKSGRILFVCSSIYFDDNECFCKAPYVSLLAEKKKDQTPESQKYIKNNYKICIYVADYDDFDIGLVYYPNTEEQFFEVLHELVNWMKDHEQGVSYYDELVSNTFEFFPDLDCKRIIW